MVGRPPSWSPEQLEQALAAYEAGEPNAVVRSFGLQMGTVHRYARLRGIPIRKHGRPPSPADNLYSYVHASGYVRTYAPHHPFLGNRTPLIHEHVRVMELHLGRRLEYPREVVHHIDHDKTNNALENLALQDRADHTSEHRRTDGPQNRPRTNSCGTPAGYKWHRRRGERCEECSAAWSEYCRELRSRRGSSSAVPAGV